MIAELQDVSNDLGEKKSKVDPVIQALILEENAEGEQEEKEDVNQSSSVVGSEDEEVEDSDESPTV
ncbi:hypothetical protein A2U01_0112925 [Trifolium medium]|uniref:Uncharacterized protein n=1 Tax=Trifolium medium TaxID=97028 RepID=A0A392VXB7_9FABA|nr:hypothetical protein [Trifolium medium]